METAFREFRSILCSAPICFGEWTRGFKRVGKRGVIQRFEYCFELAWKTVKDYLEASGLVFATVTPRQVLKDAFAAKILKEGPVWMDMLDHRNLLSHTYDSTQFNIALDAIHRRYLNALAELHEFLHQEASS